MRNALLFSALLGASFTLLSCEKPVCEETLSGVVLGGTCADGAVIELDPQYAIGRPVRLRRSATDSIVGRNAISTDTEPGTGLIRGQRLYFRAVPPGTRPERMCPTVAPLGLPHYDLINVASMPCQIE